MVDLSVECPYEGKNFDFSQFNTSGSILDVLVALMAGNKENAIFTLNEDLTTTLSVSDFGKVMQLQKEMAHARRNYADQATIEEYTKQLNELMSAKMTCKGVNQVIPMKLEGLCTFHRVARQGVC